MANERQGERKRERERYIERDGYTDSYIYIYIYIDRFKNVYIYIHIFTTPRTGEYIFWDKEYFSADAPIYSKKKCIQIYLSNVQDVLPYKVIFQFRTQYSDQNSENLKVTSDFL